MGVTVAEGGEVTFCGGTAGRGGRRGDLPGGSSVIAANAVVDYR